jgi:signal transduction histidine kinase
MNGSRSSPLPRLLIIDDVPENVEVLGHCLTDEFDVEYALSGPEGLELIRRNPPQLVLLDAMMPGMDGYAVCAELQAEPGTADIPIVFVTAKSDAESESRALAAGAVDFLHKPVNPDVAKARVTLHLALKARENDLRRLNDELETRVAERTQSLRDALVAQQAAAQAKALFLANVHHELRTPMNAIVGLSDLLARQLQDSLISDRVARIRAAGAKLLELVDDIITSADLQAGRVTVARAPFALTSLLNATADRWRARAEARGLQWVDQRSPELPDTPLGDSARLGRLLDYLLDNAVRFSEQGFVALRVRPVGAIGDVVRIRFEVEDRGIGIPYDRQGAVFNVFEQGDNSPTRAHSGIGLGLALCKQITELMGGEIGMSSEPGHGSLFWVVIPFALAGPEPGGHRTAAEPGAADAETRPTAAWDWNDIRRIVIPLIGLLAEEDFFALVAWQRDAETLNAFLAEDAPGFKRAMDGFDFAGALQILRRARARYPELS